MRDHWLTHPGTQGILRRLEDANFQALLVGGCVRDALMDRPVGDIDIATSAPPDRVIRIMGDAGFRVIPTGLDHGTVTVIADDLGHEVTTFRRDVETDGRHATVAFTDAVTEDAARRDFTVNALYVDRRGDLHDPLGGLKDVRARRVRFIGDPARRISEDHLRILRFFRFHAWLADPTHGLDPDGLSACAAAADGIARLSRERIGAEMVKLLTAPDPGPSLAAMHHAGILAQVLPGADPQKIPILVHLEGSIPSDSIRRLALLGSGDAPDRLRLSRRQADALALLRSSMAGTEPPIETAFRHGKKVARDVALLKAAMFETPLPNGLDATLERAASATFPVTAADLMPMFQGAALGMELRRLESLWIASGFTATRDDLLA